MLKQSEILPGICGLLPVHKPVGMISKDVSRHLGQILGKGIKMGHVGSLDPIAEGVLPILLGSATRLQDILLQSSKQYYVECTLGYSTDTLDATGIVTERMALPKLKECEVRSMLHSMIGSYTQIPPLYSAVKYQGKPLYRYARDGRKDIPLDKLQREVTIFDVTLRQCEYRMACAQERTSCHSKELWRILFTVTCSKGTYIRCLCDKLARLCGSLGVMSALTRTHSSGIDLNHCISWECIKGCDATKLLSYMIALEDIPLPYPKIAVNYQQKKDLGHGRKVYGKYHITSKPTSIDKVLLKLLQSTQKTAPLESRILVVDYEGRAVCIGQLTMFCKQKNSDTYVYTITQKRGLL